MMWKTVKERTMLDFHPKAQTQLADLEIVSGLPHRKSMLFISFNLSKLPDSFE